MSSNIDWTDIIKKEARGLNDYDLGEIQEVSNGLILTQRGIVNKEIFSIPQSLVESYDGKVLRLRISEDEATSKYKKYSKREQNEIPTDNSTTLTDDSSKFDATKMDTVIDNAIGDTLQEALTPPTAEEMEIEKKVDRERAALVEETKARVDTTEENTFSYKVKTARDSQSELDQDDQPKKPKNSKEDVANPLKKEEAGIS